MDAIGEAPRQIVHEDQSRATVATADVKGCTSFVCRQRLLERPERDLEGKVLLNETVRHVFQIDKGLVTRFDIENAGGLSAIAHGHGIR